jgi:iron complex outermembrane recepter protein
VIARFILLAGTASILVAAAPATAQDASPPPEIAPPIAGGAAFAEPLQLAAAAAAAPATPDAEAASTAEDQAATPGAEPAQPDTIVVTATRRVVAVQDVPIPISVLSGATLVESGTQNIGQVVQLQPSLTFYQTNPRNAAINIRGLGAPIGLTNDGLEQGVGIYIDQVYYSRVATALNDLYDVQRVEVLRGPQGTLFGKNTTAGAINVITNPPTFHPEAQVEVTAGSLRLLQARAAISGPLSDTLAFRLAGSGTSRRGTIYNVASDKYLNDRQSLSGRASLLWRPNEDLDLTLTGDYTESFPDSGAQIYVRTGTTQRPLHRQFAALAAAFNYAPPSTDPFDRITDLDAPSKSGQRTGGVSLRGEWDLGAGTLTSVSAWRFWNWYPSSDRDFTGLPITTVSANPSRHRQLTQEVRYASKGGETFDYVLGAFYFHQKFHTSGAQEQGPAASRFLLNPGNVPPGSSGCNPPTANACNPDVLDGLRSDNDIRYASTSAALYGQLTWHLSDSLRLQPGVRVNLDKKNGAYEAVVTTGSGSTTLNNDQRNTLPPQAYAADLDQWNVAYDLTASYDIAPNVMAYATYAHSFKSAGINMNGLPLSGGVPVLSAATVRPEKIDSFELGLKTQLFDRRATLNLSGYWTEIKDYQTTVTSSPSGGVVLAYLANAEKVRVRGAEAELSVRPSERLSFYVNGAYTDAKYVSFPDAPCPPELSGGTIAQPGQTPSAPGTPGGISPASCDASGSWLPGVSKWSASYGFEYNLPTTLLGKTGEAYLGFDGSARTKFSSNPTRSLYTDVGGYTLANFRLGFRSDDNWNLFAWVKNAFDERYFEVLSLGPSNTGLVVGLPGDPRTWGVTFSAGF